jgi:photosystem II stability/assembly factor-like uncharacterized protein
MMNKAFFIALTAICIGNVGLSQNSFIQQNQSYPETVTYWDSYFDSLKLTVTDSAFHAEGNEYNRYKRFRQKWDPILSDDITFETVAKYDSINYKPLGHKFTETFVRSNNDSWRELGPKRKPERNSIGSIGNTGQEPGIGPIDFINFYEPNPDYMLCGSLSGGLFYSTDAGNTWKNGGTDKLPRSGVKWAVHHPNNEKIWYAISSRSISGNYLFYTGAVYRTEDEGITWTKIGDHSNTGGIWNYYEKLLIDPQTPNTLYLATKNGVFKTINGHTDTPTWSKILSISGPGQKVYDIEFQPNQTNVLFAAVFENSSWSLRKTSDQGQTWSAVTLPSNMYVNKSNYTIEVSKADPNALYIVTGKNSSSQIWRYEIVNDTWTLYNTSQHIDFGGGHGFGISQHVAEEIYVSKDDRYQVRVNDTWTSYKRNTTNKWEYHVDVEDFVSHPNNANEIWMANHGGVHKSINKGKNWINMSEGLGVAEPKSIATSTNTGDYVMMGLYHDGSVLTDSPFEENWSPTWNTVLPGDGLDCMIDPVNPQYMYGSSNWKKYYRTSNFFNNKSDMYSVSTSWLTPMALDYQQPENIYLGSVNKVVRSTDRGLNFEIISPSSILYFYPDAESGDSYSIYRLYSTKNFSNYLYAYVLIKTSAFGVLHKLFRTKQANATNASDIINSWEEVSAPKNDWLIDLEVDFNNPNIVYLLYKSDNYDGSDPIGEGMVLKVDYSNNITITCPSSDCIDLSSNIPKSIPKSIKLDHNGNNGMYLATSRGVFYTYEGSNWTKIGTGLPHAEPSGLELNYVVNKVRVALDGRGLWELDMLEDTQSDLYIRDRPEDDGKEPNSYTSNNIWSSPDIKVTLIEESDEHINPVPNQTNYVKVTVINRGLVPSKVGDKLHVYFSKASTGISWPNDWINRTELGTGGQEITIGDELTDSPLIMSNDDIIQPGESKTFVFTWTPPNHELLSSDDPRHFCLYARIEEDRGFARAETNGVWGNTRRNNNIAWRNVSLGDCLTCMVKPWPRVRVENTSPINDKNTGIKFNVPLTVPNSVLDQYGVYLQVSKTLYDRWVKNGRQAEGIEETELVAITIDDPLFPALPELIKVFKLKNRSGLLHGFSINTNETFYTAVRPIKLTTGGLELNKVFSDDESLLRDEIIIEVIQLEGDSLETIVGGQTFIFKDPLYKKQNALTTQANDGSDSQSLIVYPNPVGNNFYIATYKTECSYKITTINGISLWETSNYLGEKINLNQLPSGVYVLVEMTNNTQTNSVTFIKD